MPNPKIKYQHITFNVTGSGQQIPVEAETDKLYNTCTGINIVLTDENAKFSTLHLDINQEEIFPEYWEVLRVKFRDQSPMGFDYHPIKIVAGGSKVKGSYTDKGGVTFPYTVTISLRLENLKDKE